MGGCWGFPSLAVPVAPGPGWQRGAELDWGTLGADGTWQEKELFHSTNPFFALPGWGKSWRGLPLRQDRAHMSTPRHPRHPARRRQGVFPSSSSPASWKTARSPVPCAQERQWGGDNSSVPKAPHHGSAGSATNKLLFELCPAPEGWKSPAVLSGRAGAMWGAQTTTPWKAETVGLKHIQDKFIFGSKHEGRGTGNCTVWQRWIVCPGNPPLSPPKHEADFISSCKTLHFSNN